jgi:hypothetical protein
VPLSRGPRLIVPHSQKCQPPFCSFCSLSWLLSFFILSSAKSVGRFFSMAWCRLVHGPCSVAGSTSIVIWLGNILFHNLLSIVVLEWHGKPDLAQRHMPGVDIVVAVDHHHGYVGLKLYVLLDYLCLSLLRLFSACVQKLRHTVVFKANKNLKPRPLPVALHHPYC